ncbi:hypothetical protein GIB67_006652 [Kingdonia uniflora]|uniref:F-box domain-containing protein n=1 Tax=Kingdonia uniflora TaxID=39325 RepID=A0A7J7LB01_9MAGN|nr:hypothetical protein GIB67_006652 [Kingdonia uniflora]
MEDLPEELVMNILSRVPVKSLGRCRCVSKPWLGLIRTPSFVKMHIHSVNKSNPRLIIYDEYYTNYFLDTELCDEIVELDIPGIVGFPVNLKLWGSCNGVICISRNEYWGGYGNVFLWNPTTKECVELTYGEKVDIENFLYRVNYGFGYNPRAEEYKVVRFVHYISMELFIGWRRINLSFHLIWKMRKSGRSTPADDDFVKNYDVILQVFEGCLSTMLYDITSNHVEIWVMKEYVLTSETYDFDLNFIELGMERVNLIQNAPSKSTALDVEELADQIELGSKFYVMGYSIEGRQFGESSSTSLVGFPIVTIVITSRQEYEARVLAEVQKLQLRYFGNQSLDLPTPIPDPPMYYRMADEEVAKAENAYYQVWQFYHLIMSGKQHRVCLHLLREDVINEADEEADVHHMKFYRYPFDDLTLREKEVGRHFWCEVFCELIVEPKAQKTVVKEIVTEKITEEDERIVGNVLIRRLIEDVPIGIDNVKSVRGELRTKSLDAVELEVEGKNKLAFPNFPGNFLPYNVDSDVFRKICKIKGILGGVWGEVIEHSGRSFRGCIIKNGDEYFFLLPDLEYERRERGVDESISLKHPKRKNDKVDSSNSATMESGEVAISFKKRKVVAPASVSEVKEAGSDPVMGDELQAVENKFRAGEGAFKLSDNKPEEFIPGNYAQARSKGEKDCRGSLFSHDNLGQKLLEVRFFVADIEAIMERHIVEEYEDKAEEEPDVEGSSPQDTVKGLGAVSARIDLENRREEDEKAKLEVVRASEEYALKYNYECKIDFDRIKREKTVNDLTQQIESKDVEKEIFQGELVSVQNEVAKLNSMVGGEREGCGCCSIPHQNARGGSKRAKG